MPNLDSKSMPSEQQMREFWEWCGFMRLPEGNRDYHYEHTVKTMNWKSPCETEICASIPVLPRLDLNNLFKYAVPKLQDKGFMVELYSYEQAGYRVAIYNITGQADIPEVVVRNNDPALALFGVIWEVIKK